MSKFSKKKPNDSFFPFSLKVFVVFLVGKKEYNILGLNLCSQTDKIRSLKKIKIVCSRPNKPEGHSNLRNETSRISSIVDYVYAMRCKLDI